jgi:hypothetical protein
MSNKEEEDGQVGLEEMIEATAAGEQQEKKYEDDNSRVMEIAAVVHSWKAEEYSIIVQVIDANIVVYSAGYHEGDEGDVDQIENIIMRLLVMMKEGVRL